MTSELHGASPAELQQRLKAERAGQPFLLLRDGAGAQQIVALEARATRLTIGRRPDNDLPLVWDGEVSRVHAELERVGSAWTLRDDGLSRNGTFVNGERVVGRRRLRDGDRLVFGETPVVFRAPELDGARSTAAVPAGKRVAVTDAQRRILVALCRPLKHTAFAVPASNRAIAEEVHLSVDAVKAHLRVLFERFGLDDQPQNQKRASLASLALVNGIVTERDF